MKIIAEFIERSIHATFEVSVVLKGVSAILELIFGFLFLFFDVRGIILALTQNELIDDPTNFLSLHLSSAVQGLTSGAEFYASFYLLAHGLVKVVLVWGLLSRKLWSYPASIAVLVFFVLYQTIKLVEHYSLPLLLLTLFDILLIYLILHEYRYVRRKWEVQ